MAQNITLLGASYTDVPAVELPKTGGGTASFTDVTDTTAAAADVASGKYFYTASGVRTAGSGSAGTWKTASCTVSTGVSGTISFNTTAKAKCFVIHWTSGNANPIYMSNGMTVGAIYTGGSSATEFKIKLGGSSYSASTVTAEPVITNSTVTIGAAYPSGTYTAYYLV